MRYGLGLWHDLDGSGIMLVGYDAGASFSTRFDPETRLAITILSNTPEGVWTVGTVMRDAVGR